MLSPCTKLCLSNITTSVSEATAFAAKAATKKMSIANTFVFML